MWLVLVAALSPFLDDRPPVGDLNLFPPVAICKEMIVAAEVYRCHVELRKHFPSWQYWEWHAVAAEAKWCHDAWDWLHWAHTVPGTGSKRHALGRLRDLIGPDAYYAGQMPPCVPIWRFERR